MTVNASYYFISNRKSFQCWHLQAAPEGKDTVLGVFCLPRHTGVIKGCEITPGSGFGSAVPKEANSCLPAVKVRLLCWAIAEWLT